MSLERVYLLLKLMVKINLLKIKGFIFFLLNQKSTS